MDKRLHDSSINPHIVTLRRPRAGNVADTTRAVRPFAIDLCTGVRTDGHLDGGKLRAFMAAVGRVDREGAAREHASTTRVANA
ncbi:MAG TPA: hypothetical protein VF292_12955 [Rhodanobacteraceae bacterium]